MYVCKYNEKLGILYLIRGHRQKKRVGTQGRLPTPADITLVDILCLLQSIPITELRITVNVH